MKESRMGKANDLMDGAQHAAGGIIIPGQTSPVVITDKIKEDLAEKIEQAFDIGQITFLDTPRSLHEQKLAFNMDKLARWKQEDWHIDNKPIYAPKVRTYTQEELDTAYSEGHQDGYKEGYLDAADELDN
jgi:flagellar biosynthesis/type III secretory pathway protein FliH